MSILQCNIVESVGRLVVLVEDISNASTSKAVQVNDVLNGQKRIFALGVDLFRLSRSVPLQADLKIGVDCRVIVIDWKRAKYLLVLVNSGQAIRRQLLSGEFVVGKSCGLEEVGSGFRGL